MFGLGLAHGANPRHTGYFFMLNILNDPVPALLQQALAQHTAGNLPQAEALYRQILGQRPNHPDALHLLGVIAQANGRFDMAIDLITRAIALNPSQALYHSNLANALGRSDRLDETVACCRRALELEPNLATACYNMGNALKELGLIDEAVAALRRAVALDPTQIAAHSALLLALHSHPTTGPQEILTECRRWNQLHAVPLAAQRRPHANDRTPGRTLRVGYVSSDFRTHACALFLRPLLQHHDPRQVAVVCYAEVTQPDFITAELQQHAHLWRNIVGLSDPQVADLIRQDQIDILVDLNVHTAQNRLLVFARQPAPVQVTWLGYPGTTGLDAMGYRLTDPHLDPPGAEGCYSEQSIRLPHCFWCYQPLHDDQAVTPLPAEEKGHITFGCLNSFSKINTPLLLTWCALLRAVEQSHLVLHAHEGSPRQRLRDLLESQGVDPQRLRFMGRVPLTQYFQEYQQIDIGLDPFPYPGGTTTCDALWMGVPVVSLPQQSAISRGGRSILTNIGLPELAAGSPEEYVRIAAALAGDRPRLAELRRTLRARMQQSPLMDARQFALDMEAAYRQMWNPWCSR